MKKLNLRLRLTVFFIVISVAVFATAGILSWTECREKVDEFFDTYQIALARRLSTANWEQTASGMQEISDGLVKDIPNADDEDDAVGFAVFNSEGQRIFHDGENGRNFHPFGRTGTTRSFFPLPKMVMTSDLGRSLTSKDNASPIRRPQPYNSVTKAMSRFFSHKSSCNSPAVLITSNACSLVNGFGKALGTEGEWITLIAGLDNRAFRSRNLKKLRSVDILRAKDVRPIPSCVLAAR